MSHNERDLRRLRLTFDLIELLRPDLKFGTAPSVFKLVRFLVWSVWQTKILRRNIYQSIAVVHIPKDAVPNDDGTYG